MRANFICPRCHVSASIPADYLPEAIRSHNRAFHPTRNERALDRFDDVIAGLLLIIIAEIVLLIAYLY